LHKPATVSGGGKSEISKRLEDMIKYGPVYVNDITKDFDMVESIFAKDFSGIMAPGATVEHPLASCPGAKSLLDPRISMGSLINLCTPGPDFAPEHNKFIESVPTYLSELMSVIKQLYTRMEGPVAPALLHRCRQRRAGPRAQVQRQARALVCDPCGLPLRE
jgi:hypothetical protein